MKSSLINDIIIIQMRLVFNRTSKSLFSTQSQPFLNFLNSKVRNLELKRTSGRKIEGQQVNVPHHQMSREAVTEFFQQKNIINKKVIVNVDYSHLLGIKRLITKKYQEQNVYKGHGSPVNLYNKQNPSVFMQIQELRFDSSYFALTDSEYLRMPKQLSDNQKFQKMQELYRNDINRGGKRLQLQYSIPSLFLPIIQVANNLQNNIYFVGLNQYSFRMILGASLKLVQVKNLFMASLQNYTQSSSQTSDEETDQKVFQQKCRQVAWRQNYNLLQPINFQILRQMKRSIKGYCFAHSYSFLPPDNPAIDFRDLKDKEQDSQKIQKHAIFSVMFGNIWNQPYTNNPFPYLAESYFSLNQEDKNLVHEIYQSNYNKYYAAKKLYIKKYKEALSN